MNVSARLEIGLDSDGDLRSHLRLTGDIDGEMIGCVYRQALVGSARFDIAQVLNDLALQFANSANFDSHTPIGDLR